jgi:hypothetical protein
MMKDLQRSLSIGLASTAIYASAHGHSLCFESAAKEFVVPVGWLQALAETESAMCTNTKHEPNRNGTLDFGCMGINSTHLVHLAGAGITARVLKEDHCTNIRVGAWIFSQMVEKYGLTWRAVGAYGAGTGKGPGAEMARLVYVQKVQRAIRRLDQASVSLDVAAIKRGNP